MHSSSNATLSAPQFVTFEADAFARRLLETGTLSEAVVARAQRAAAETDARLDRAIVELGLLDEQHLTAFLAEWLGFPIAEAQDFEGLPGIGEDFAQQKAFLKRVEVAPVSLIDDVLSLAFSDPFDLDLPTAFAFRFNCEVRPFLARRSVIKTVLERFSTDDDAATSDPSDAAEDHDIERLKSLANDGPVVTFVADVLRAAVAAKASDIHFEAQEDELAIRFRMDGILRRRQSAPNALRAAVASRLKVMAGLNISERRRPQDGRISLGFQGRNVDLRVSTLPTQFGESIVLRVLDRARVSLNWSALGFQQEMAVQIERITSMPHGLFLVTGPTGSGKSTTLYTALSKLNAEASKIFSIEDPIEYALAGVNQVQVQPEINFTFAEALRAVLRQDPNVVMVGEIRDEETAENAVRAALMGRMVLSTVHTNSAVGAIDRLLDLNVPGFLLSSVLRGVVAQRLLRTLCQECVESDHTQKTSCVHCGGSGYSGRKVVAEVVEFDASNAVCLDRYVRAPAEASSGGFVYKSLQDHAQQMLDRGEIDLHEFQTHIMA